MNPEDTKQDINLAVISRDIHHMSLALAKLETALLALSNSYVSREELRNTMQLQAKLHEDIEKRLRGQDERNSYFETRLAKLSTEIKIWLTVGAFIIGAVEAVVLAVILKAI